jgi:hypothetical protein
MCAFGTVAVAFGVLDRDGSGWLSLSDIESYLCAFFTVTLDLSVELQQHILPHTDCMSLARATARQCFQDSRCNSQISFSAFLRWTQQAQGLTQPKPQQQQQQQQYSQSQPQQSSMQSHQQQSQQQRHVQSAQQQHRLQQQLQQRQQQLQLRQAAISESEPSQAGTEDEGEDDGEEDDNDPMSMVELKAHEEYVRKLTAQLEMQEKEKTRLQAAIAEIEEQKQQLQRLEMEQQQSDRSAASSARQSSRAQPAQKKSPPVRDQRTASGFRARA